jgi:hypothetical protein
MKHSGKAASTVLGGGNVGSAITQRAHDGFTCRGITDLDEYEGHCTRVHALQILSLDQESGS